MKTKFLWISLLLALALLFCSCTNLFQKESETTGTEAPSVAKQTVVGKWYCADAYVVVELRDDLTFDYYNLLVDDYAYAYSPIEGTYTLSGNTVTLPVEGFDLVILYDSTTDAFSVQSIDLTFSRVDILPTKIAAADPEKFQGVWYHEDSRSVLAFATDGTLDSYTIQAGYYTYSDKSTATYTLSDAVIEVHFEGSEYATELTYNPSKDTLSDIYGDIYKRMEELPTEHPIVAFPNYAELDCSSVITLGSYKGLDLTTKSQAYAILDIFSSYYSNNKDKTPAAITEDRAAQYGDEVVIDYTGYLDGVAFSGGSAKNQTIMLIADSGYIPGFAEGVIGHKTGETFDVSVTFPEDYGSKDLAGKSVIFTMTLHTIYELRISDEEINSFTEGEYSTYDALLTDYLQTYRENEIWTILESEAIYTDLPLEYFNYFYQYYRDYYHSYAFSLGMDYEKFLTQYGLTEATLLEETRALALPYIISQVIYKAENLTWDEELYNTTLNQYIKDAMEYFKYTEEEAETFVLENESENLNSTVVREIVTKWLLEQNN